MLPYIPCFVHRLGKLRQHILANEINTYLGLVKDFLT